MQLISKVIDARINKGCLRVAFASSDGLTVDEHFGRATQFLVFDISKDGHQLAGKVKFVSDNEETECNPENKHFAKIEALKTCHIIYSQSIGGPAAARLTQRKIHPMIAKDRMPITIAIDDLSKMLNGPNPPWVRKLVNEGANYVSKGNA